MRLTVLPLALVPTLILILILILGSSAPGFAFAQEEERHLVLVGHGRFALFADLDTLRREGPIAEVRTLQVAEEGFSVNGRDYWGGWSRWRFDCDALMADRLDFASLAEGGHEGPATPEPAPPYPASPGGDAYELLTVACGGPSIEPRIRSIDAAVDLGRRLLSY